MPPHAQSAILLSVRHQELARYWQYGNIRKGHRRVLHRLVAKHQRKAQIHLNRAMKYIGAALEEEADA